MLTMTAFTEANNIIWSQTKCQLKETRKTTCEINKYRIRNHSTKHKAQSQVVFRIPFRSFQNWIDFCASRSSIDFIFNGSQFEIYWLEYPEFSSPFSSIIKNLLPTTFVQVSSNDFDLIRAKRDSSIWSIHWKCDVSRWTEAFDSFYFCSAFRAYWMEWLVSLWFVLLAMEYKI